MVDSSVDDEIVAIIGVIIFSVPALVSYVLELIYEKKIVLTFK